MAEFPRSISRRPPFLAAGYLIAKSLLEMPDSVNPSDGFRGTIFW
jgi:hypothetical protein